MRFHRHRWFAIGFGILRCLKCRVVGIQAHDGRIIDERKSV